MKQSLSTLILIGIALTLLSCKHTDTPTPLTGEWVQEASIDAPSRSRGVIFNIADKIYITTGFNGNNGNRFLSDLWLYDESTTTWIQKTGLPDSAKRSGAVSFTIDGKGYVGLGYNGTKYLKDFYVYNPSSDSWTKLKDFAGPARSGAIAFTINGIAYVGTGTNDDGEYKDFWMYDEANDNWIGKAAVPKIERTNAFSFVINGKGYVGGGTKGYLRNEDFYEYDPASNAWTQKNDLKDDKDDADLNDKGYNISREQAATFVVGDMAYVVGGRISNNALAFISSADTWEYNSVTDTWKKKVAFTGGARFGTVGYTLGGIGYVGAGTNGAYLNDKWKFIP